ncbi:unnamed protein product [Soboliphyme baturini]|uniref:Vacuolar protein sorting-associated protein 18 homolog n=1 Tax=Soboliphyme baturini TaxID=241478 RepID=A0A183IW57_9BILA|nr:unnamed protein product [Soboliphyme baturini]
MEGPIFVKRRINFRPSLPITHLISSNGRVVIGMKEAKVLRILVQNPDSENEVNLSAINGDEILLLFLDPSGQHLIATLSSGDTFYLHWTMKKPKLLTRLKDQILTSVAFIPESSKNGSTGCVLMGTSKGHVFSRLEENVTDDAEAELSACGFTDLSTFPYCIRFSSGIEIGSICTEKADLSECIQNRRFMRYSDICDEKLPCTGIVVTEFHTLLTFKRCLYAVFTLSGEVVLKDIFTDKMGDVVGVTRDPISGFIWVYTNDAVFKYGPEEETRFVQGNVLCRMTNGII